CARLFSGSYKGVDYW
nr:immunoglobulin heavy chain junction region [Macaca mulatta]